jgi:hypothetical protein
MKCVRDGGGDEGGRAVRARSSIAIPSIGHGIGDGVSTVVCVAVSCGRVRACVADSARPSRPRLRVEPETVARRRYAQPLSAAYSFLSEVIHFRLPTSFNK